MPKERSYGIIAFYGKKVLLVQHHAGHWGFPKGHAKRGESNLEAAEREFQEETGVCDYDLLDLPPLCEKYIVMRRKKRVKKVNTYYMARVADPACEFQADELLDILWIAPDAAMRLLTFPASKDLLKRALAALEDA